MSAQAETKCFLGRIVDESGAPKEPSQCIIQYGGRVRLPDKLMEILNNEFCPDVIWWQPDEECFAFDSTKVQPRVLDVWFRGTKLSSFIRSLNRWGFRRVFYHSLVESAVAFHHPLFCKKSTPDQLKSMKMSRSGKSASAPCLDSTPQALPKSLFRQEPVTAAAVMAPAAPANAPSISFPQLPTSLSAGSSLSSESQQEARRSPPAAMESLIEQTKAAQAQRQQQMLLKLIDNQNQRNFLALKSQIKPIASSPTTSTMPLLASLQQESRSNTKPIQHQLWLLAAQQQANQQQQQRAQQEAAFRMAIAALSSKLNNK